ncbi:zinc dependent phospholipase C [Thermodesulfovibrio aggregans]|uniref:Zinc dependent phospholipase C n=1 Tax=Thermodesulfovibrio aggregans TaxID=86166 RepID=A0A0U9HR09_9BACT|nr:zinc dependent phospholipase C family protein [Thermodesulfovibrio aggregans]GAQ95236.1 zinc dependent phospholipase C [Thermodesulfovibrio aggregans]
MSWLLLITIFVFLPETSYAWGPLTHTYLGSQILSFSGLVTMDIFRLIKHYKEYFIYGNIIPDIVIGKKYLPDEKNPHSWKTGFMLLNNAERPEEKSFAYGFLTHLAADAILHNEIREFNSFKHMIFEIKADRVVDRFYWFQIMSINKRVRKMSERFFEQILLNPVSIRTSKKIYRSLIFLSGFNKSDLKNSEMFNSFHLKSLTAMLDILNNRENSKIITLPPHH